MSWNLESRPRGRLHIMGHLHGEPTGLKMAPLQQVQDQLGCGQGRCLATSHRRSALVTTMSISLIHLIARPYSPEESGVAEDVARGAITFRAGPRSSGGLGFVVSMSSTSTVGRRSHSNADFARERNKLSALYATRRKGTIRERFPPLPLPPGARGTGADAGPKSELR